MYKEACLIKMASIKHVRCITIQCFCLLRFPSFVLATPKPGIDMHLFIEVTPFTAPSQTANDADLHSDLQL